MAYEYECEEVIKNVIKELIYFKKGKNELAEKEIDEIYTKAKAFDAILKIDAQATDEDRITGQYESDIETPISNYREDE
ncbi:hypothetical protein P1A28_07760 [Staphylococcus equorum]|uniref:hypothetical protein n=1 Tax=Staphylococcus equorum TaxID=246432 RepID=UPI0025543F2B|nr:hypothetical protein [Staphylococcus equorum]MDK9843624.1 hypothetical protein [Staphylococcus equorum]